jgi:hypothetical protein
LEGENGKQKAGSRPAVFFGKCLGNTRISTESGANWLLHRSERAILIKPRRFRRVAANEKKALVGAFFLCLSGAYCAQGGLVRDSA